LNISAKWHQNRCL